MKDVAIVGGGVVGLSLARALTRAGASVALFERAAHEPSDTAPADTRDPAPGDAHVAPASGWACHGASSLPVALVNPWRGRRGAAHADDLAGLAATWRWADELASEGLDAGARRSGVLRVPTQARQARAWRTRAAKEPSLSWLEPDAVPGGVHAPYGALHVAEGGWIRADAWRSALATSARRGGAELHAGAPVTELATADPGWRLRLDDGATHLAGVVLLAIGADAPPATDAAGPDWPSWIRTRGEEVALTGVDVPPLPLAGGVYGVHDGARTWVGGGHRPADRDDPDAPSHLREALAWSVPGLAEADVDTVWSGVRAKRADARPVIRAWRDGVWIVGAFAGRGFLCAALEAERFAATWRCGDLRHSEA